MTAEKIVSGERRDFRHACAGLARSAFTLMRTPPHDKLHVDAETVAGDEKQPLVTPIADISPRLQVLVGGGRISRGWLFRLGVADLSQRCVDAVYRSYKHRFER